MTINPKIREKLQEFMIPVNDGIAYLLAVYYDVRPSYTPTELVQRINVTNILGLNDQKELIWNIHLFEEQLDGNNKYGWVVEWMDMFSAKNSERRGAKASVIKRFQEFFANNPDVSIKEVFQVTEMYLRNTESTYVMKSHKFIADGVGKMKNSTLEEWLERYRIMCKQETEQQSQRTSHNNTMM